MPNVNNIIPGPTSDEGIVDTCGPVQFLVDSILTRFVTMLAYFACLATGDLAETNPYS